MQEERHDFRIRQNWYSLRYLDKDRVHQLFLIFINTPFNSILNLIFWLLPKGVEFIKCFLIMCKYNSLLPTSPQVSRIVPRSPNFWDCLPNVVKVFLVTAGQILAHPPANHASDPPTSPYMRVGKPHPIQI